LLGLANLPLVEPDQAIEALREYNHILEQRIQGLRAKQAAGQPLPFFVEALFDYSLTLARAEQDWIRRFITDLEQRDGSEN
jgi:hypothetical protein